MAVCILRMVTNPCIFTDPAPTAEAMMFVDRVRQARRGYPITATPHGSNG